MRGGAGAAGLRAVKRAIETAVARSGVGRWTRALKRSRALVLAYHNVVENGEGGGDRSLHLRRDRFARQLAALAETHEVVDLGQLGRPGTEGTRPRVAITFDDAYRGAVRIATPLLADLGFPATIFVAPGLLGDRPLWWDEFAPEAPAARAEFRERALAERHAEAEAVRALARRLGVAERQVPADARTATEDELHEALRAHAGLTLASHSWSHRNLASLAAEDPDGACDEFERPLRWLEGRFPAVISWVAYPFGLTSARVERLAAEAGLVGGVRVGGGWVPVSPEPFRIPRMNVPAALTADGFRIRIDGLGRTR